MTFSEWRRWVAGLPWALRWFIPLVLIRPFIGALYFLKDVSVFLSPLYIVGVATPILIIASLFSRRIPRISWSFLDQLFFLWGAAMVFNALAVLTIGISLVTLEMSLKLATPVLIYLFLRHLVQTKRDLVGVLTTFLYSSAPVFAMMIYERVVSPLGDAPRFTRGFYRYSGLYADVMGYGVYFVGVFLVAGYLYLADNSRGTYAKAAIRLGVLSALCVLGLLHIHHNASWVVIGALSVILLFETLRRGDLGPALLILALFLVLGLLFFNDISQNVEGGFEGEVAVLEGQRSAEYAFHGRMSRWTRYVDQWDKLDPAAKLFGVSLTSERPEGGMMFGIHNDYLRIAFSSGLVGLSLYLLYYLSLVLASCRIQSSAERFLIRGTVAIILLYSVSTVPTLYYNLLNLCLPVFAFAALPRRKRVIDFGRRTHTFVIEGTMSNSI